MIKEFNMKKILNQSFRIFILTFLSLTVFGQNVGINILEPSGKLHIKGSENISQLIIDADTNQNNMNPLIKLRKSDGTELMWLHSDHASNAFIGLNAGRVNNAAGGGLNNTFLGAGAGYSNTMNSQNVAVGNQSLYTQSFNTFSFPTDNVAIGYKALFTNQPSSFSNGKQNTAVGSFSLHLNTIGTLNTANGWGALYKNTGHYNTAIGAEALYNTTAGYYNTATGYRSLFNNTTGLFNTANGYWSLYYNTIGEQNTAIGYQALFSNKAGSNATAIGYNSMLYANNTTTPFINYNVAVGFAALRGSTDYDNNTGNYNTALGSQSLWSNRTGSYNTANGTNALYLNIDGSRNTALGYDAGVISTNLMNSTAIGYNAKVDTSNALVLGGTGVDAVHVGIGTQKPQAVLDVNGDLILRSANLVAANGINLALDVNTSKYSYYRLTGPTAQFEIAGITAGIPGRLISLFNASGFPMQLNNTDNSAVASNQILTGTSDDLLLENMGMVSLRYDGIEQKWIVSGSNRSATAGIWEQTGSNIYFDNNVGIGTDEPDAPLTIQTGLDQAGFSHMTDASTTVVTSEITSIGGSIGTSSEDIFSLNAGGEGKVHVWPDGRVVIGDDADPLNFSGNNISRTTPTEAKLTLETPINSTGWIHIGGQDSIIVSEGIGGVSAAIGTASNHAFRLNTNGVGRLHVLNEGSVVVGTNSQAPVGKFTVHTPNNTNGLVQVGGDGQVIAMRIGGSSATIGTMTPHIMRIVANGLGVININPGGDVAIGTPDPLPGYKLSVNGNIKAKELVIETAGWPDYVFAKEYKPLSLSALEKFISQHHHLPGIPSAAVVEEKGMAVGEMQKKMMEKIEELTLYIIQQQKLIEELQSSVATLKQ